MNNIIPKNINITAMSTSDFNLVNKVIEFSLQKKQVDIQINHTFHAGLYCRTIKIPKDVLLAGALIKIPTLLILSGDATVFVGDEKTIRISGEHCVISAESGRKQIFRTHKETFLSMFFATNAKTIDAAEREFTDEYEQLMKGKN